MNSAIPSGWSPEQARRRLEAATPGPWREESRTQIGTEFTNVAIICDGGQSYESFEGNRVLIANAPTDIAALLALLAEATDALLHTRDRLFADDLPCWCPDWQAEEFREGDDAAEFAHHNACAHARAFLARFADSETDA